MPTTAFPYTSAAWLGQFTDGTGAFVFRQFDAVDTMTAVQVSGTGLSLDCFIAGTSGTAGGYVKYSIDGGTTWVDFTPTGSGNFNVQITLPVFSGFSETVRTVLIRETVAASFYLNRGGSGCFIVTGAAPAASIPSAYSGPQYIPHNTAPDSIGRPGILNNIQLEAGYATRTIASYDTIQPATLYEDPGAGQGGVGAQIRFYGTISDIFIGTYLDAQVLQLWIDGVQQPITTTPNTGHWGEHHVATGLDTSQPHLYGLACVLYTTTNISLGSGAIAWIRTQGGTGLDTTRQPAARPIMFFLGDSLIANSNIGGATGDLSWTYIVSNNLGYALANSGISSTTAYDYTPTPGSMSGSALIAATQYSGSYRASADLARLPVPPAVIVEMYGTNDLSSSWLGSGSPTETTAMFLTGITSELTKLVTSSPSTCRILSIGILPRSADTNAYIDTWNAQKRAAITSINSRKILPYADGLWLGIDPTLDEVDGVHINATGAAKLAKGAIHWLAPPSGLGLLGVGY